MLRETAPAYPKGVVHLPRAVGLEQQELQADSQRRVKAAAGDTAAVELAGASWTQLEDAPVMEAVLFVYGFHSTYLIHVSSLEHRRYAAST